MTPERSCLACRRTAPAAALLRLAVDPSGLVEVEVAPRLPGRGAWVCPSTDCLRRVERQPERLARALRRPAQVAGLEQRAHLRCQEALLRALGPAWRAGLLASGGTALPRLLRAGGAAGLILAQDASPRRLAPVLAAAQDLPIARSDLGARALGAALGRGPRSALAVRSGPSSRAFLRVLRFCASLGYPSGSIGRAPCPKRRDAMAPPGREGKGPAEPSESRLARKARPS